MRHAPQVRLHRRLVLSSRRRRVERRNLMPKAKTGTAAAALRRLEISFQILMQRRNVADHASHDVAVERACLVNQ